jgi:hypothetical protein
MAVIRMDFQYGITNKAGLITGHRTDHESPPNERSQPLALPNTLLHL